LAGIVRGAGGYSVWTYDLERDGTPTRIADGIAVPFELLWFPDGKRIALSLNRDGPRDLWAANADGSGTPQKFLEMGQLVRLQSFTPDGRKLVIFSDSKLKTVTIETAPNGQITAGNPEVLWDDDRFQVDGEVSPDGRWVAYASNDAGSATEQVLVRPLQGPGPKVRITTLGGKMPRWSKAGKELFYRAQDERIMVVPYTTKGDTFQPGLPELWSPRATRRNGVYPNYDVTPDGKRIITFPPSGEDIEGKTSARFTVLLNFFDELERRTAGPR
jgi:serine/threonine-protein kinase